MEQRCRALTWYLASPVEDEKFAAAFMPNEAGITTYRRLLQIAGQPPNGGAINQRGIIACTNADDSVSVYANDLIAGDPHRTTDLHNPAAWHEVGRIPPDAGRAWVQDEEQAKHIVLKEYDPPLFATWVGPYPMPAERPQ